MKENEVVDKILEKVIWDEDFRREFEHNRDSILSRLNLSPKYLSALLAMDITYLLKITNHFSYDGNVPF